MIKPTTSGSVAATASTTDSRGRTGSFAGTIPVLAYNAPQPTKVLVRRCTSGGTLDENGVYFRVDLTAAVSSLVNGTERNSLQIKVLTRRRGTSTWTARNVINHSSLTYNSNFVISGGGNYPIDDSFDVLVQVIDQFNTAQAQTVVATAAVLMHWSKTGVGVGKFHENGVLDVGGDVYATGEVRTRGTGIVAPVGMVTEFAGTTAPTGWLLCQGQAVSRTTYAALFAVIGTAFGAGNGTSTFNVPNRKGRVGVGLDAAQTEFDELGDTGGAKTVTLTAEQSGVPQHYHSVRAMGNATPGGTTDGFARGSGTADAGFRTSGVASGSAYGSSTGAQDAAQSHQNLPPYVVMNYLIKV